MGLYTSLGTEEQSSSSESKIKEVSIKSNWSDQLREEKKKLPPKDLIPSPLVPFLFYLFFILLIFIATPLIFAANKGIGNELPTEVSSVNGEVFALNSEGIRFSLEPSFEVPVGTGVNATLLGDIDLQKGETNVLLDSETTVFIRESFEKKLSLELRDGYIFVDNQEGIVEVFIEPRKISLKEGSRGYIANLDGEIIINMLEGEARTIDNQVFTNENGVSVINLDGTSLESETKYFRDRFIERATLSK